MSRQRLDMGWKETHAPYVRRLYENREECEKLILESDVVLLGWSEERSLEQKRLASGKPTIRISERIYREGQYKAISPRGLQAKYREHYKYRKSPVYLLCCGAYVASDFHLIRSYPEKMYRWGYFPEKITYDIDKLQQIKEQNKVVHLLWTGRMIPLKHPEFALELAKTLQQRNIPFHLDMVGDGPLRPELEKTAEKLQHGAVSFAGSKAPEEVRGYMEKANIFLFTSNYLEGWGAVVNEAMNSGCALIASAEAGAVPFLMQDGINGLIYKNGSYEEFEAGALQLVADRELQKRLGKRAYETIAETWNAQVAATRLITFCHDLLQGGEPIAATDKGPLSRAEIIKPPKMLRTLQEKNHLE